MAKRIEFGGLGKRPDGQSWAVTASHLLLVLAPVYAAAYGGRHWWWILMWACCGVLMNGLLNLMHECAHFHTFQEREASDALGRWVLGPLLVADFDAYRRRHWEHHKHLGVDGDTKDAYLIEITGGKLFLVLGRCLILREAIRKFALQVGEKRGAEAEGKNSGWVARTALTQAVFAATVLLAA